jgi:hypothetical protein
MKIQLDTKNKTIKVEESVNLGEFIDFIKKILPDKVWREYKLETSSVINWSNPIIIEPYKPHKPIDVWYHTASEPCIYNSTGVTNFEVKY